MEALIHPHNIALNEAMKGKGNSVKGFVKGLASLN
jgi:hypothetical protein